MSETQAWCLKNSTNKTFKLSGEGNMKKNVFLFLITVLVCFYGQGVLHAATVEVSMVNFAFEPKTATINVGDTVKWTNTVVVPHTTTSGTGCAKDGKWDSGDMTRGATFSFTFDTPGEYPYYCIPHCNLGMTGTIIVNGGTGTTTVPGTTTSVPGGTTTTTVASTTTSTVKGGFSLSKFFPIPPEVLLSSDEWPLANKDYCNTRATFASGIHSRNVLRLRVAWTFDIPGAGPFGGAASNPLIIGNRVYLQDLKSNVYAISLRNGKLLWNKDFNVENIGPNGPAVGWGKVFITRGATVTALDMRGNELWSTILTEKETEGTDIQLTAYGNLVYVSTVPGASVTNFYTGGAVGMIYALDQNTGAVQWKFNTVDTADIWGNPSINSGGGAWYPPAIDVKTGLMFWGTGNPAPFPGTPDFPNGTSRPGPNLYTNTLLALETKTGALAWYKQVKPHDLFDLDFQLSPILTTARINGTRREIVIGGGKVGKVFAFDRATGEILWQTPVGEHQNDELTELPEGTTRVFPGVFGGIETPMALGGNILYVPVVNVFADFTPTSLDQSTLDIAGGTGELVAIDVSNGAILWDKKFNAPNFGGATVVNDLVFTATFDGKIYALDRNTGDEIWRYQATGGVNAWPAVAGNTIIFPVGLGQPPQLIAFKIGL